MACFLVPGGVAVITTVLQKAVGKEKAERWRLSWLNTMLWGGVILLAVEHLYHGEVVPWPPFLTAMANPADVGPMLHEMATIGTAMSAVIMLTWVVLVALASILPRRIAATGRSSER